MSSAVAADLVRWEVAVFHLATAFGLQCQSILALVFSKETKELAAVGQMRPFVKEAEHP